MISARSELRRLIVKFTAFVGQKADDRKQKGEWMLRPDTQADALQML